MMMKVTIRKVSKWMVRAPINILLNMKKMRRCLIVKLYVGKFQKSREKSEI